MKKVPSIKKTNGFRRFFVRGLAIVLPTILTIWIIVYAYRFVDQSIAQPINQVVRIAVLSVSNWPAASERDFIHVYDNMEPEDQAAWTAVERAFREAESEVTAADKALQEAQTADLATQPDAGAETSTRIEVAEAQLREKIADAKIAAANAGMENWQPGMPFEADRARRQWVERNLGFKARRVAFRNYWESIKIGDWVVLDLIGLIIAVLLIYAAGLFLGSYLGGRIYTRGEQLLQRLPLFKQVYPYVKQVTEFLIGDTAQKMQFNRVVAVEYPRKGIWSLGLVTGDTMRVIQEAANEPCMTIFIPSSPTPFTGYVITVPKSDTIELPISIDDALRFTVSAGVILPESQLMTATPAPETIAVSEGGEVSAGALNSVSTPPNGGKN